MSLLNPLSREYSNRRLYKSLITFLLYAFTFLTISAQKLKSDTDHKFNFSDLNQNKASVIIFFDIECPICQKYTKLLKEINQKYSSEGIKVYMIYPHKNIDKAAFKSFKTEYQFDLPIYFDNQRKLLSQLKGRVTPEVFLLNSQNQTIYHGAIDNWFYSLGKSRAQATENYLIEAIEDLLKGENVKNKYREPIGCAL
ncbi:redoxin domain-containing protein [Emticicia sp. C21]|uniref:redoxin domain-containing protein n=1 Tax=Emticicia sp. C21 TaxID=2302915 RepID=UPI000E347E4B|nr:redoxin domain-containing protein [Emticicia sp. C21]RFS18496.1 hypothetical protein D0T08_04400 [Emticicia sp. C21]